MNRRLLGFIMRFRCASIRDYYF